ncbi:hypothetical protein FHR32_003613 [Streptosporangium album]|uniref:DUF4352 domain-containing protein n=1 Tax=Streptosporangium album TaxID=47479 RepID=A0A7W7RXB6_9ACTN|nr:hypothetical protein [Streptosporangium album]MBB4939308.1 hypothetical protein [Streptosporangium album]
MGISTPERTQTSGDRRASSPPGRWRRLGGLLAGVALAAAAVGAQTFAYTRDDRNGPLTWTGDLGEQVAASRISVQAKAVHAARAVETPGLAGEGPKRATTSGIFLVVDLAAQATWEPQRLAAPELLTEDGRRYVATDKVDETLTITQFFVQPAWWVSGVAVFELPVAELAGARIVVHPERGILIEPSAPEVEIDLGLDESTAARLVSEAKDVYTLEKKK